MTTIKQFLILILSLTISGVVFGATDSKSKLTIEPIYGVETSFVRYPNPGKYVTRANYGARLIFGVTHLSAETEFTQARSNENYLNGTQKVTDTSDRLGLGIRSTFTMTKFIGYYFRAGGRASRGETKIETSGVTETKDNPLRIDPYAGAGIQLALGQWIAINLGATLVRNGENKYNSEYTIGLSTRFGKF